MAAPTFGAAGTYYEDASANPAFGAPASVVSTSIVVLKFYLNSTTTVSALPSGFAHAPGSPVTAGTNHSLVVAWARNPAGSSYTATLSGSDFAAGKALRYDDCVTSGSPWDANSGTGAGDGTTNDTVTPAVSMTTLGDDELLFFAATCWAGGTWTPPSGFTERVDQGFGHVTADDKVQAAAGATGSVTATVSNSDKRSAWLGALLPVASGTTHDATVATATTAALATTAVKTAEATSSAATTAALTSTAVKTAEATSGGATTAALTSTATVTAEGVTAASTTAGLAASGTVDTSTTSSLATTAALTVVASVSGQIFKATSTAAVTARRTSTDAVTARRTSSGGVT